MKITFIPTDKYVESYAPLPIPAKVSSPSWVKKQQPYSTNPPRLDPHGYNSTVKRCPAVMDTIYAGYLLLCPVDVEIDATGEDVEWRMASIPAGDVIAIHSRDQITHYPFDRSKYHDSMFRIHPKWVVTTPKGYSCMFMAPMHRDDFPLEVIPGIIDTDNYGSNGAFSFLVPRGFKGVIKKGTPIVQVIPFKREEWTHKVSSDYDILKKQSMAVRSVFKQGYKLVYWVRKIWN